jgi:hypothetical protein
VAIAVAVPALALAACSGDDGAADPAPTTSVPTTTTSTTVPPTTVPPTTEPADSYAEWCAISVEAEERFGDSNVFSVTDPDLLKAQLDELRRLTAQAGEVVPDEIADAWATTVQMSRLVQEAIADADYDVLTADFSALADLEADDDAADDAIDAFNFEHCGIDITPDDDDDDDFDVIDGSLKDQFIGALVDVGFTDDEALCVFGAYDFTAIDTPLEDAAIAAALEACGIPPDRLVELSTGPDSEEFDRAVDAMVEFGLSDDEATCVVREIIVAELEGADEPEAVGFEQCGLDARRLVRVTLGPILVAAGLTDDQIDCVVENLDLETDDREATLFAAADACDVDRAMVDDLDI